MQVVAFHRSIKNVATAIGKTLRRRTASSDRTVLVLIFLVSLTVALLSLIQIKNRTAVLFLGAAALLYLFFRFFRR
jgi:uncharacterized membrane protein